MSTTKLSMACALVGALALTACEERMETRERELEERSLELPTAEERRTPTELGEAASETAGRDVPLGAVQQAPPPAYEGEVDPHEATPVPGAAQVPPPSTER
ncbi:MAG: hypothetical protein M3Y87_04170 [Myxococcota bacterium]|nr:hypothetical protein [Myxococcota bacterium]